VSIDNPRTILSESLRGSCDGPLAVLPLKDESLSVSAISEKFFRAEGRTFGHIIDPRTGQPSCNALLAAVVLPSATETDALSTALLTLGPAGASRISTFRPSARTLVLHESKARVQIERVGI
jgi:thiamine biosynthesis lipoprotein